MYNESDDAEKIVVGAVIEPWEWWKMVLLDLNILVYSGCAFWAYFIVRSAFLKPWFNGKATLTTEGGDE